MSSRLEFLGAGAHESGAQAVPQRVVSYRLFNANVHRLALLAALELAIGFGSLYAAILLRFAGFSSSVAAFESTHGVFWQRALLISAVFLLSLAALGLYQLRHRASFTGVLVRLALALLLAQAALALIFYVFPGLLIGRGVVFLTACFAFVGFAIFRYVFLRLVDEEMFKRPVLVYGGGARAASIGQRLRRRTDQRGFRVVGYVRAAGDAEQVEEAQAITSPRELVSLALRHKVEEIVVAMDDRRAGFPTTELLECRLRGIQITDLVTFLERESGRVSVDLLHPSWLIFSSGFRSNYLRLGSKRLFDIAVSLAILLVSLPIWLLAALAIWLEDRGPVFYRQLRMGQNGKLFPIYKFRSMRVDAEREGQPVWARQGDDRVTRIGRIIRRLRIDELPQVYNVLVGHMSFVGPRPERPAFVDQLAKTIPYYPERHFVKPGVTGWAQVRYSYGASEKDAREKLEYDLYYVKHHSLVFDLMVLLQTVEIVLFRIGSR